MSICVYVNDMLWCSWWAWRRRGDGAAYRIVQPLIYFNVIYPLSAKWQLTRSLINLLPIAFTRQLSIHCGPLRHLHHQGSRGKLYSWQKSFPRCNDVPVPMWLLVYRSVGSHAKWRTGHSEQKNILYRHSFCVERSSTVTFIAVVIATAMSGDGDDIFFFFVVVVVMHWMSLFRWERRRARDENAFRVRDDGEWREGWKKFLAKTKRRFSFISF